MEEYKRVIDAIYKFYNGRDVVDLFCHGGCFYLARRLTSLIDDSLIMWNRKKMHCAAYFDKGLFDITGRISKKGFYIADSKAIQYMKKHFIPDFNTKELDKYLRELRI